MTDVPLEAYLAMVRADAHDTVRAVAAAIAAADADFDCRITYQMLVYTFDVRWHDWVVAIGVSSKAVNVRFLYGQRLEDPAGRLRPGSTTAATLDLKSLADVDAALITAYVREAVARHDRTSPRPNQP